ncbi:MAG: DUF3800 domain-containing protein [Methanobacteriaceae archaeon]
MDESGDLGSKGSKYFVMTILKIESLEDCKKLKNIIKKMRRHKFKKKMKSLTEVKAYLTTNAMKYFMLKKLQSVNIESYSIVLNKENYHVKRLLGEKNINESYITIVGMLIKKMNIKNSAVIRLDNFVLDKYKNHLKKSINGALLENWHKTKVYHSNSEKWEGIQFADLIAWSIFVNFENKNETFYKIILECGNHKIYQDMN